MIHLIKLSIAAVLICPMVSSADDPQLSAEKIMQKSFFSTRVKDSKSECTLTLTTGDGKTRTRKTITTTKLINGTADNMRVIKFLFPADIKGTKTLMVEHSQSDDDLWIYLPAAKKVKRLVSSNKKDSFVGTDFSYGDIIGHKVNEWRHKIVRTETLDGVENFVIESLPKSKTVASDTGYGRRLSWIRKDNYVETKAELFDLNGRLYKTMKATDIKLVDAKNQRWQPMTIEEKNVQSGHFTTIQFNDFKTNQGLSDQEFTVRALEKD